MANHTKDGLTGNRDPDATWPRCEGIEQFVHINREEVVEMIKKTIAMISAVMISGLLASSVYAVPITLGDAQLDLVAAGGAETVSGFVCTVNLHGDGLLNANNHKADAAKVNFVPVSGYDVNGEHVEYVTVAPSGAGDLMVPAQATNTGTPGAGFSTPGDTTYSPIWSRANF